MKNLLILEDDRISGLMYESYFEDTYNVFLVYSAQEFLDFFEDQDADVALIDVNIKDPEFTGIDLVKKILQEKNSLTTRFILLTAYGKAEVSSPSIFVDYHQKPINLEKLATQIESNID